MKLFKSLILFFLPIVFYSPAGYTQLLSHPHIVTRVSPENAQGPNEVSIAINPTDKNKLLVVSMQFRHPDGSNGITNYSYYSTDGGKTFIQASHPNPERRTQGDDAVTFDAEGTAYHSYISFRGIRVQRPRNPVNGIFVTRSNDNGQTWGEPVPVVDHINTVIPFEDKPWLVTDNTDSEYRGNVYVSWTRFDEYGSTHPSDSTHILFSRSIDGGKTFSQAIRISDHGGNTVDDGNTVEGAVPSVGVNGEIYVVWSGPKGLVFDTSIDGGLNFGVDKMLGPHVGGWDFEIEGIGRANGMPVTGVDHSAGKNRGRIYVNWTDNRNGDQDIFLISSGDGGKTWTDPLRVNNDATGNGKDQFFTWMAIDPIDGSVNIAFYDRRNTEDTETTLTLARSVDGGKTFQNYSVNQPPFATSSDVFFGDYIGISAYDGRVALVYQHFIEQKKLAISAAIFDFE